MAVGDPKKHPAGTSPAFPRPGKRSRIPLSFKKTAESAEGADVNAKDKYEWTPLHNAATQGHKKITELLIAKGADVNAKSDFGTPLDYAIKGDKTETADLLRKHGGKTAKELKAEGK
jgi:ankyrin repeat protein